MNHSPILNKFRPLLDSLTNMPVLSTNPLISLLQNKLCIRIILQLLTTHGGNLLSVRVMVVSRKTTQVLIVLQQKLMTLQLISKKAHLVVLEGLQEAHLNLRDLQLVLSTHSLPHPSKMSMDNLKALSNRTIVKPMRPFLPLSSTCSPLLKTVPGLGMQAWTTRPII